MADDEITRIPPGKPQLPPPANPPPVPADIEGATQETRWLRDKLIESNGESLAWHLTAIELAKQISPDGWEKLLIDTKASKSA